MQQTMIALKNLLTEHFKIEFNALLKNLIQIDKLQPEILIKIHFLKSTFGGLYLLKEAHLTEIYIDFLY